MKNYIISAVIALCVAVAAVVFVPQADQPVGASTDSSFHQFFRQGLTAGGRVATTSTAATYTTSARDLAQTPTVYSWLPNKNITVSVSGTSTQPLIPNVGDVATVYFRNASTTAAATITFAAKDAGVDMQFAEATGGDLVLAGLDWAKVTFIKTSTHLVTVIFDEMTEAD